MIDNTRSIIIVSLIFKIYSLIELIAFIHHHLNNIQYTVDYNSFP